ncbi:Ca2+ regulator and membrane fusion protein Fig1-domain-containing protein [Rhypophila decipiens]|uniref:Ca2+ regulator and membrane fusion protein Fig1-domain-containing protein n=1 Tax=Rhypophila decipiens TaxID=261697 RepID=A0AAN6YL31_9PEZI|nr:Ca2+ regulator and membrane fusion protein Fig1-domain-containing protein [Rhypophila decipiens]
MAGILSLATKIIAPKFLLLRLIPYTLIIPVILFEALSLSGCVGNSPTIPSLYIVSIRSSQNTTIASKQVRLGFFGICGGDGDDFQCRPSSGMTGDTLAPLLFPDINFGNAANSTGPNLKANATATSAKDAAFLKDIIDAAIDLQGQVYVTILAAAAFFFLLGVVFLLLHKRDVKNPNPDKPLRSKIFKRGTYGLLALSTGLIFTAALATTEAAGVLKHSTQSINNMPVFMKEGITLQVLQWMSFGFSMLFTLATPILAKPGFAPFNKSMV